MDPVSKSHVAEINAKTGLKRVGRPFPKGVSGNPGGRPNKSLMQKALEAMANDKEFVDQWVESVKKRSRSKGMAGVLESREVLDRVDGKVVQAVEMEVSGKITLEQVLEAKRKAGK